VTPGALRRPRRDARAPSVARIAAGLAVVLSISGAAVLTPGPAAAQAPAPPPAAAADPTAPAHPSNDTDVEIDAQRRELESLKKELEQRKRRSQELRGKEKDVRSELKDLNAQLALTEKYLKALERRRRTVSSNLGDATSELSRTSTQLSTEQRRLAWRLREIYKRGRSRDLEYILSARSFADLVSRTYYLARIAQQDKEEMLLTRAHQTEVRDTKARLEDRKRELDRLKAETNRQRRSQRRLTARRRQLLRGIQGERKSNEQAAAELERASKRIQSLIEELEKKRLAAQRGAPGEVPLLYGDFAKNKGRLPWPVAGKVVASFGRQQNPRFNTATYNSGIDIAAPVGTPFRAVSKGRVDFVSVLEGYGRCAILNHGGGFYTLYAHASEILVSVGKEVAAGEIIGRVGDTGTTIGSALHFEIRHGKTAVNPLDWFR
jgi:septal ring factor EnvC (AmiA/AmiB activator)